YDVVRAMEEFANNPRSGEVYNLGGGRENSASILESVAMIEKRLGRPVRWRYVDTPRRGDHICYISDLSKLRSHYPNWSITRSLPDIIDELIEAELTRLSQHARS
ncbi:MAG: NAD-dependent epimerase, partial [Deltaproteobacteria bacterium]|nr:NAD-dependent epimerase [Deltaproteobacteria bacterium]